eukprot:TRINITY_DN10550_c0_g1_i2.p1 TRINITY_DN10550_c0_g1~~TRINITY_DN10550_c0_g1_i2.p1  ORF type:complete len:118 (+),score=27.26 TRINITY_DN10550_c0_g1_i2:52-405(+)
MQKTIFSVLFLLCVVSLATAVENVRPRGVMVGGRKEIKITPELEALAQEAVVMLNEKENSSYEFVRLVKVQSQVVSGIKYYFTVEIQSPESDIETHELSVWSQPWRGMKQLVGNRQL